jgi:hypothetical protein
MGTRRELQGQELRSVEGSAEVFAVEDAAVAEPLPWQKTPRLDG